MLIFIYLLIMFFLQFSSECRPIKVFVISINKLLWGRKIVEKFVLKQLSPFCENLITPLILPWYNILRWILPCSDFSNLLECRECVTHLLKLLRCNKNYFKRRKFDVQLAKFSQFNCPTTLLKLTHHKVFVISSQVKILRWFLLKFCTKSRILYVPLVK